MAPLGPSARDLRAQRIAGSIPPHAPPKTFRPSAATTDSFLSTKHDKRLIKHSSFLSRVVTSSSHPRAGGGVSKKRSRGKSGSTSNSTGKSTGKSTSTISDSMLEGLADALPQLRDDEAGAPDGRVQLRSLRSRRGALRRKERIVRGEMERFGASMARLAEARGPTSTNSATTSNTNTNMSMNVDGNAGDGGGDGAEDAQRAGRWAALRGFIAGSMMQNPAFGR